MSVHLTLSLNFSQLLGGLKAFGSCGTGPIDAAYQDSVTAPVGREFDDKAGLYDELPDLIKPSDSESDIDGAMVKVALYTDDDWEVQLNMFDLAA